MNSAKQPEPSGETSQASPTFSEQLDGYNGQALERVRQALPAVARELMAAGIARIEVHYDGSNDSGMIEEVTYWAADGSCVDPAGKVSVAEEDLKGLFYDLLQVRHGGWENNDGAFGQFDWDLEEDTLYHSHTDRFTEYYTTGHDGI